MGDGCHLHMNLSPTDDTDDTDFYFDIIYFYFTDFYASRAIWI